MEFVVQKEEGSALTGNSCWELVQRIVASPSFAKSERLSSFLTFVCRLSLAGDNDKINEQAIGVAVFGRKADYDTAVDGIVRTHATRLRQRLDQYFQEYGRDETLLVEIPPGAYVPAFSPRKTSDLTAELKANARPFAPILPAPETASASLADFAGERPVPKTKTSRIRTIIFAVACSWMALSIIYLGSHPKLAGAIRANWIGASHPLWAAIFNKHADTLVVSGDMALLNFETQTGRSIMLGEYTRNNYVNQYMDQFALESFSPASSLFLTRSVTEVDSQFIEKLFRLPGIDLDRTTFSSARDIQLPNLQNGNIVLLGDFRLNPWVQAFEPKMNFYFADDGSALTHSVVMNRDPEKDEQASYHSTDVEHVHTEYSVIALQPNLSGSGNALLLEGQSPLSTEAAESFVENESDLGPFLDSIRQKNGAIPHFEVLLKVKGMSGNVASFELLADRIDK